MAKKSAGLLIFRRTGRGMEVFLVHPGGPFWMKKDAGAWSIPKGEYSDDEDPASAARREFEEETGFAIPPDADLIPLSEVKQPGGKVVKAWACEGDYDASLIRSNPFSLEWPPKSGRMREFPEVDRAAWFSVDEAREKILKGQLPILEELCGV